MSNTERESTQVLKIGKQFLFRLNIVDDRGKKQIYIKGKISSAI